MALPHGIATTYGMATKRNAQAVAAWNRKGGAHTSCKRPQADPSTCEGCGEPAEYCECDFDALDEALFGGDDY